MRKKSNTAAVLSPNHHKVMQIIAEQAIADESELTPMTKLGEDLQFDSLDFIELTMTLEEKFGFEVPEEHAEKLQTVGAVLDYVDKYAV
jgi:acyl carrier protein